MTELLRAEGTWCYECGIGREAVNTRFHRYWLICWRMAHTVCTCVRPWDETVAQIPERYSFCGMDCATHWMNRSVEESRQTADSVPLTNADLGVKG